MKKVLYVFAIIFLLPNTFAQSLYDPATITQIDLVFEEENWDELLDDLYADGEGERLIATCMINGIEYREVGVRFRGGDSYSPTSSKNAFNIKLDEVIDQRCQGYSTIKLSNGFGDPSMIREVLAYEIGRKYMDVPLANFAVLTVNGENYGVFTSIETIDDAYHQRRLFCSRENVRFKGSPNVPEVNSSLEYYGADPANYEDKYQLESATGWDELTELIYTLNFDFGSMEEVLDIDRALWMLAFNNILVNLDSYTGAHPENYYLIHDENNRFMTLPWDLEQAFGSRRDLTEGGGLASIEELIMMEVYLRASEGSHPLLMRLLSNETYRKKYLAHAKTILAENFENGWYLERAETLQNTIEDAVAAAPNNLYDFEDFDANIESTVEADGESFFGIAEVMEGRIDYLTSTPDWEFLAPSISTVNSFPENPEAYSIAHINALVTNADRVILYYRNEIQDVFEQMEMFDDGLHGDGDAGDLIYGASIELAAKDVQFYIYADNANAGKFSPVRAAHEYYHIGIGGDVVINEIMPQNELTVEDEEGKFEDWIELYNRTDDTINLAGYYLSDSPSENPLMWQFPDSSYIPAYGYLTVWMDEDTLDEGLHANFKLSASGESISFSDPSGFEISRVKFPEMGASTTYGRFPNGTGPFIRMFPTFAAENGYTSVNIQEEEQQDELHIFPNPTTALVTINSSEKEEEWLEVYNMTGVRVYASVLHHSKQINVENWERGMYIVLLKKSGHVAKLIVQ